MGRRRIAPNCGELRRSAPNCAAYRLHALEQRRVARVRLSARRRLAVDDRRHRRDDLLLLLLHLLDGRRHRHLDLLVHHALDLLHHDLRRRRRRRRRHGGEVGDLPFELGDAAARLLERRAVALVGALHRAQPREQLLDLALEVGDPAALALERRLLGAELRELGFELADPPAQRVELLLRARVLLARHRVGERLAQLGDLALERHDLPLHLRVLLVERLDLRHVLPQPGVEPGDVAVLVAHAELDVVGVRAAVGERRALRRRHVVLVGRRRGKFCGRDRLSARRVPRVRRLDVLVVLGVPRAVGEGGRLSQRGHLSQAGRVSQAGAEACREELLLNTAVPANSGDREM